MDELEKLKRILQESGPVAVAVSGGVDSMTLGVLAHRMNRDTEIYHAVSAAVPKKATERVRRYGAEEGWNLRVVDAGEIRDRNYLANPANRCYYCKTHLYDTVASITTLPVVSGTNRDDLEDYRPGLVAAGEHRVRHPWVEAGIGKAGIRKIAGSLGLADIKDLPAGPCLSSRVSTGILIDENLLPVIDDAEEALWRSLRDLLPLRGVRCRVRHGEVAVELDTPVRVDANAEYALVARDVVAGLFSRHGYSSCVESVSVESYRRGSAFLVDTLDIS